MLGCVLTRKTPQGPLVLKIVETEAYHQDDPASHSFRGLTVRTAPMFDAGGAIYVYFTYGMHYCLNVVVGQKGVGEAVLLRAAEPLQGIQVMQKYRGTLNIHNLASGPAKLTQALGITNTRLSGKKFGPKTLELSIASEQLKPKNIIATPRIGIKQATQKPWRFYIRNNPFVSH